MHHPHGQDVQPFFLVLVKTPNSGCSLKHSSLPWTKSLNNIPSTLDQLPRWIDMQTTGRQEGGLGPLGLPRMLPFHCRDP
jgi:hypothetical protein